MREVEHHDPEVITESTVVFFSIVFVIPQFYDIIKNNCSDINEIQLTNNCCCKP